MRLFQWLFYRSKHRENTKSEQSIYRILAPSVLAICICAVYLCGTSWAWFTATTSTGMAKIQAASYTVTVTATSGANNAETKTENGITTVTFNAAGTYTVTLTPTIDNTATTGYCKVVFGETEYYTPQLTADSLTFTVNATAKQTLTVIPQWGTYSGEASINDSGSIGTPSNSLSTPSGRRISKVIIPDQFISQPCALVRE